MNSPITRYTIRLLRLNAAYRSENRRLRGDLARVHEVADVWEQKWREEHDARVDLERLTGWLEAT